MKRIAFPVISAIICLQILSGCKETSQSSNVRVAGKSAGENTTLTAKKVQSEAAIKEEELNLSEVKSYGDIVEFILKNIRGQQADTFGMDQFVKSHRWMTVSLYGKNPDATVLATTRADAGKVGYTAFQTAKTVYLDKTSFSTAEDVDQAKLILRQIVTGLRLQTKGLLSGDTLSADSSLTDTQKSQLDEARDVLAAANQTTTDSPSPAQKLAAEASTDANIVGSNEVNQTVAAGAKKDTVQAVARLDAQDMEGIRVVTDFLMVRGNSATIAEIKEQLLKYKIVR
ncbi:MAG: hypothetical protein ACM3MG_12795 [Bacillota bacterium]